MSNDNRFDNRSVATFKKDIKASHRVEAEIAVRLCIKEHTKTGEWPELIPAGVDFSGEFVEDTKKVTSAPDFRIGNKLVEITRSDVICNRTFHWKVGKINRAIKDGNHIVFVNGYRAEKQPNYIMLSPEQIAEFTQKAISKYGEVPHPGGGKGGGFINKASFRYEIYWIKDLFQSLPCLIDILPSKYLEILESTK